MTEPIARPKRPQKISSARSFAFKEIYRASPNGRIQIIKAGVSATSAKRFIAEFKFNRAVLIEALSLKTATINKKAKNNQTLSTEDGERVIGLAKLVGQLEAMIEESGDPRDFDATDWMSQWLRDPLPALGGARPIELLDTMEGQALVGQALAQIQSGAYA